MFLLTLSSAKIDISNKNNSEWAICMLYLLPYNISGHNVCAEASVKSCATVCLNYAGRGRTNSVQNARKRKTKLLFDNRIKFKEILYKDINSFVKKCIKLGKKPAIRLNGTSDLDWIKIFPNIFNDFQTVQWYDYTKIRSKYDKFLQGELPSNYHLTFSRHELNEKASLDFLKRGGNVAIVFRDKNIPKTWNGFPVFNGDNTDLRFLDPKGVVGLYAKGKAKHDQTGFVVDA